MKVLFVNTSDSIGGAARAAVRIMHGVQQFCVDSKMLVKSKSLIDVNIFESNDFVPHAKLFSILDWCANKLKNKWQHFKWHPYKGARSASYLSDLRGMSVWGALQNLKYDILHLNWINERFLDVRELKRVNKPIVWTLHDSWAFTGVCHVQYECENYKTHCRNCPMLGFQKDKDLAYEVFEKKRKAYERLDLHIVTPSRWLADCARQSALLGRFPISVIPNCLDTELFSPQNGNNAREVLGLDLKKKYVLYGAMQATRDPNKGFAELRNALELIKDKLPNTELLIFGTNDIYESLMLPIPGRTIGYVTDDHKMAALYNAADVTVVPSRSENLSNTIMESLSCTTPVVAFDIGGNGDMIEHLVNGYLARYNDCADLANGIRWCLGPGCDHHVGKSARQKVLNNFSVEIISEQYARLYQSILNE